MAFLKEISSVKDVEKLGVALIVTTILSIIASVLFNSVIPMALPIALIGVMSMVARLEWMYLLLVSMLVLSIELDLPGFSIDFPSEILMLAFTLACPVYFLLYPKKLDKGFFNHPIFIALMVHFVWIAIATIFSWNQLISLKYFLAKSWYIVAFTVMGGWFVKDYKNFKPILWAIIIPLAGVVLWTLNNFRQYSFDFEFVNKTMHPIYFNHVDYGVILAMVMPFTLILRFLYKGGGVARFIIDCCSVLFFIGIVYSYTRAAYVSLLILPFAWLMFRWKITKHVVVAGLIGLTIGVGYLTIDNKYLDYAPSFEETIYHANFSDHLSSTVEFKDVSTMERVYRWVAGFNMALEHPVTGFGPNCFNRVYKRYTLSMFETYVSDNEEQSTMHNYYLMTLVEQGIPGFLIFLSLCIIIVICSENVYHRLQDERDKMLALALAVSILIFLANNFMADLVEIDEIGAFFFLFIAILINLDLKSRTNKKLNS